MAPDPAGRAPYRRIADQIIEQIQSGELRPGDKVPSVTKIMESEGVSRATAARVPGVLRAEGYAIATPGVGTIVIERRTLTAGSSRLKRLASTGQPYAANEGSTAHKAARRSVADPTIAEQLGVELRDEVVIRWRVFLQDDKPAIVSTSFIHPRASDVVPEVMQQGKLEPFWQDTYKQRTGKEITRSPERFGSRVAGELDREVLGLDQDEPEALLVVQNVFHDDEGPIEVWDDAYAPGMWQFDETN